MYKEILNVGIPAGLEELLMAVVAIAVNLIFEIVGGTSAVATYTIVMRLISIAIMPTIGIATSTITVVGIAYGAKNYKNIKIATRYSIKFRIYIFNCNFTDIYCIFQPNCVSLFIFGKQQFTCSNNQLHLKFCMAIYNSSSFRCNSKLCISGNG